MPHVGTYLLTYNQELRELHTRWLKRKEEERRDASLVREPVGEEKGTMPAQVPTEVETPIAFVSKNLPATTGGIYTHSSVLQDAERSSETFVDISAAAVSSPTLSFSTVSDLTPTDFGEEVEEQTIARHDAFYFEDGNVEIACGDTLFRVHSTVISFSSSKLRDMFSPTTLLSVPMPDGRPRVAVADSTEDFAVLLKMIYTPGWVFTSLEACSANRQVDR